MQVASCKLQAFKRELDVNGDGRIAFIEFAAHVLAKEHDDTRPRDHKYFHEIANMIFDMVDANKSNHITVGELNDTFAKLGMSEGDIAQLFTMFDEDDSGKVDREEFVQITIGLLEESAEAE